MASGLSVKRNRKDGTYGVFKYSTLLIGGMTRSVALRFMSNQKAREQQIKRKH